jgi:hypothetical protein
MFWFLALLINSLSVSYYIKKYRRSDLIIAMYIIFLAMTQILAMKITKIGTLVFDVSNVIFPFTFQIMDSMNENFGKKETQRMILIAFITQIIMSICIAISLILPAAETEWWLNDEIWHSVFGQNWGIIIGSWLTLLISNNLDAIVFDKIKQKTKNNHLWIRNVFSDIPGLFVDTIVFVTLTWVIFIPVIDSWALYGTFIIGQLISKWFFGIIDTPFIYLEHYIINKK